MPFVPDQPAAAPRGRFVPDQPAAVPAQRRPDMRFEAPQTGTVEALASLASGLPAAAAGGISGLVASLFGGAEAGADVSRAVSERLTYEPRSELGRRYTAQAAVPFEWLHEKAIGGGEAVTDLTGSPLAGAITTTALETAGPVVAAKGAVAAGGAARRGAGSLADSMHARRAARPDYNDPKRVLVEAAQERGLSLPPTQVNPSATNSFLESLAGKVKTGQTITQKNQAPLKEMVAREAGVPDGVTLTDEALDASLERAGAGYDAVRGIPGEIPADEALSTRLRSLNSPQRTAGQHFAVPDDIAPVIEQATPAEGVFTGASGVENIKLLRERGKKAFNSGDEALGNAYFDAAAALEETIGRHLEATPGADPSIVANFRAARQQMAKTHDVERALLPGGEINAQKIAKAPSADRMTGDLALIRDLATQFEKGFQNPAKVGSVPMGSPLWTRAMALAKSFIAGSPDSTASSVPILGMVIEPAARALITSRPYQNTFVQHPASAGLIERLARAVAPKDGAATGELSLAPPGTYIPPAQPAGRAFNAPNPGDRVAGVAENLRLADDAAPAGNEIDIGPFLRERQAARAAEVEAAQAAETARQAHEGTFIDYDAVPGDYRYRGRSPLVVGEIVDRLTTGEPRSVFGNEVEFPRPSPRTTGVERAMADQSIRQSGSVPSLIEPILRDLFPEAAKPAVKKTFDPRSGAKRAPPKGD